MRMIKNKLWVRCSQTTLETARVFFLSTSAFTEGSMGTSNPNKSHFVARAGKMYKIQNPGRSAQLQVAINSHPPWLHQAPMQNNYRAWNC